MFMAQPQRDDRLTMTTDLSVPDLLTLLAGSKRNAGEQIKK